MSEHKDSETRTMLMMLGVGVVIGGALYYLITHLARGDLFILPKGNAA